MTRGALTILIAAGGTGGHVYPALAVAQALQARGVRVTWLGTREGLEARAVPGAGIEFATIKILAVRGSGLLRWLLAPWVLLVALAQAACVLRRQRVAMVLGMGGYVSAPGALAARLLGLPLVIHEQNAVPGLVNRLASRIATRTLEAFPNSFGSRPAIHTGNPVRAEIVALDRPQERLAQRAGPMRVLVLGGSQGARVLNQIVPVAVAGLESRDIVEVWHQAGPRHVEATRETYARAGVAVEPVAFIDDMAQAYRWADLVVCRAGAMTVAELAAAGTASILVPFPSAVDDHQTHNARHLANAGAAVLLPQVEMSPVAAGWIARRAAYRSRAVARNGEHRAHPGHRRFGRAGRPSLFRGGTCLRAHCASQPP